MPDSDRETAKPPQDTAIRTALINADARKKAALYTAVAAVIGGVAVFIVKPLIDSGEEPSPIGKRHEQQVPYTPPADQTYQVRTENPPGKPTTAFPPGQTPSTRPVSGRPGTERPAARENKTGGITANPPPSPDTPVGVESNEPKMIPIGDPEKFRIGKYEVTNEEYRQFLADRRLVAMPYSMWTTGFSKDRQPVAGVSYREALEFCLWLSDKTKETYRLPTVYEWRQAACGNEAQYPWRRQTTTEKGANYSNPLGTTKEVGTYAAENHGTFDMGGNVAEWCDPTADGKAVARGCCWKDTTPEFSERLHPGREFNREQQVRYVGFRLARDP